MVGSRRGVFPSFFGNTIVDSAGSGMGTGLGSAIGSVTFLVIVFWEAPLVLYGTADAVTDLLVWGFLVEGCEISLPDR